MHSMHIMYFILMIYEYIVLSLPIHPIHHPIPSLPLGFVHQLIKESHSSQVYVSTSKSHSAPTYMSQSASPSASSSDQMKMITKVILHGDLHSYQNEVYALKRYGKYLNDQYPIIMQKYIPGKLFFDVIRNEKDPQKRHQYYQDLKALGPKFYKETGMIHNDIHGENVLVDSLGNLHLIDFGEAEFPPFNLSSNELNVLIHFGDLPRT